MCTIKLVTEPKPINVSHDTYRRECRYTRGIHVPKQDFLQILDRMSPDTKIYFEFHNPGKPIKEGTYLNGHAGLARAIVNYYKDEKNTNVNDFNNGKDFYVKII